jgi:Family of unknown function (DUF5681)
MKMGRDYTIGYRKPPEHSRFVKGKSGNPKGRPKERKNLKTDFGEVLREMIIIRVGDRTMKVTKQRALALSLVARGIKGDSRAINIALNWIERYGDPNGGLNPASRDLNFEPNDNVRELTTVEKFECLRAIYEAAKEVRGLPPALHLALYGVEKGEEAEVVLSTCRVLNAAAPINSVDRESNRLSGDR